MPVNRRLLALVFLATLPFVLSGQSAELLASAPGRLFYEEATLEEHGRFAVACGSLPEFDARDRFLDYVNVQIYRSHRECVSFEEKDYCRTYAIVTSNNTCAGSFLSYGEGLQLTFQTLDSSGYLDPMRGEAGEELPVWFDAEWWLGNHGLIMFSAPGKVIFRFERELMGSE